MSYEEYWHSTYSLEQEPSVGLTRLLEKIENKTIPFNSALDIGCGEGRNFSTIKKYSRYLVGIEPNQNAAKKADELRIADEIVIKTLEQYPKNSKSCFDLIVSWRVLHLGTFEQCLHNIQITKNLLSLGGYLALAVSDRTCPYFEKTRLEKGGSEIEPGTILRTTRNNDVRHFFSMKELKKADNSLSVLGYVNFKERKGSSAQKMKKYHGVLYKKCQN